MFNKFKLWPLVIAWIVLAPILWIALVPAPLSTITFAILNVAVVLGLVIMSITKDSSPTRSLAGILYDAERAKPGDRR